MRIRMRFGKVFYLIVGWQGKNRSHLVLCRLACNHFLLVESCSRVEFYFRVISVNCQPHPALRKSPSVGSRVHRAAFLSVSSPMWCQKSHMPSFFLVCQLFSEGFSQLFNFYFFLFSLQDYFI